MAFEQGLEGGEGISPAETGEELPRKGVDQVQAPDWGSAQRWEVSVAGQTGALPSAGRPVWLGQSNSAASYVDHCQQNRNLLLNEMSSDQRSKIYFKRSLYHGASTRGAKMEAWRPVRRLLINL